MTRLSENKSDKKTSKNKNKKKTITNCSAENRT